MRFAAQPYKFHARFLGQTLDFWDRFCDLWVKLGNLLRTWQFNYHVPSQGLVIMQGDGGQTAWECHCSRTCRHDDDDDIPREIDEIYDLNRAVAKKMEHVFLSKGIPVVPSLGEFVAHFYEYFDEQRTSPSGNNDIWRKCFLTSSMWRHAWSLT